MSHRKDYRVRMWCAIGMLFFGCKHVDNQNNNKEFYADFIVNNIVAQEEFSLPSYYPIKDETGNTLSIDSIFNKPKMVFRFSERNCDLCIQAEMDLINRLGYNENIIGLASYNTQRTLKMAKEKYHIHFPVYYLTFGEASLLLPDYMEEYGYPYWFIIGNNFHAKYFLFPDKQFPEISEKYFNTVARLLNAQSIAPAVFDTKTVDLGTVKSHQTYEIKFKYTNRLSVPLIIKDIKTTCGCTVPQWDKEPLMENESSELTVSFTPEEAGYNSKTIMVYHNQSESPVKLFFKANVE
jgi:hypothetical protein